MPMTFSIELGIKNLILLFLLKPRLSANSPISFILNDFLTFQQLKITNNIHLIVNHYARIMGRQSVAKLTDKCAENCYVPLNIYFVS